MHHIQLISTLHINDATKNIVLSIEFTKLIKHDE